MSLPKRYNPKTAEPRLQDLWQKQGTYHFSSQGSGPVYAIDTPPATVSGFLHLGHVYSYSQTDFMARFWRMNGHNVFYPMGYDDNGLPTERLVERQFGVSPRQVGRSAFAQKCLEVSESVEKDYEALWQRLGLSVDWRHTYRTIDAPSRRIAQHSFIDLHRKGLVYRADAPSIWCPECGTAIAQAELNDQDRESEFVTLDFRLQDGASLPIATTRPELLPACVAIFVHPDDARFRKVVGQRATVPLFRQRVPVLEDPAADPEKGTGAVMCCTFGDTADVAWWRAHGLPLVNAIDRNGRMTDAAGEFAGLQVKEARQQIVQALESRDLILGTRPTAQSVRVHERCDTPVEYIVAPQWFVRVLDFKQELLDAGEELTWHPPHMKARYTEWVENLSWDWCISRQRHFGVPFPVWYCASCGNPALAHDAQLPVDPNEQTPQAPCACGCNRFTPETDVMDTWATSSLTPQIAGRWLTDGDLSHRISPMSLRPQAHEIIRTWAFYTIVKSRHHFGTLPWKALAISGWALAPEGAGKISKSRGGGPVAPADMIDAYSADAVRYWAAGAGFGRDAVISEEKIQAGARLVTKLWNTARFSDRFLKGYRPPSERPPLSPADLWMLSRTHRLIQRATDLFRNYEYAAAKIETEGFFWRDLADNYLEMAKRRLYEEDEPLHGGARYALHRAILTAIKLFAPFLPHVTEEIYLGLFAEAEGQNAIHTSPWPSADERLIDDAAENEGEILVQIATAVRRYKSARSLPLGSELARLLVTATEPSTAQMLQRASADLISVTRAREVEISVNGKAGTEMETVLNEAGITVALISVDGNNPNHRRAGPGYD